MKLSLEDNKWTSVLKDSFNTIANLARSLNYYLKANNE